MSINLNDIATELQVYLGKAANQRSIKAQITQKTETMKHMTTIRNSKSEHQAVNAKMTSVVQAFQKTFNPVGDAEFSPNIIKNYRHKVDVSFYPDDVHESWLSFLEEEGKSRKEWPITRYIIEELLIPQIAHDREKKLIFNGVYNAGTPTVPGASMDGLGQILQDGITSGNINEVTLAAITKDNIFDQVEEFVDAIGDVYDDEEMGVFMSPTYYKWYKRDKRNTHGGDTDYTKSDQVDFTNRSVIALPSMSGSDVIFATPKWNMIRLVNLIDDVKNLEVQLDKREILLLADWWEGVGFHLDEAVWASVPGSGSGSA